MWFVEPRKHRDNNTWCLVAWSDEDGGVHTCCEHDHATSREAFNCPDAQRNSSKITGFGREPIDYQGHFYKAVQQERRVQDKKWGGAAHDDQHTPEDWIGYIVDHAQRGKDGDFGKQLVRVAALAMAAWESLERQKGDND